MSEYRPAPGGEAYITPPLVAEALAAGPAGLTLDLYQAAASQQLLPHRLRLEHPDGRTTIYDEEITAWRYPVEVYLYDVCREERRETLLRRGEDLKFPDYDYQTALSLWPGVPYAYETEPARAHHCEEMGDLMWGAANLCREFGINASHAIQAVTLMNPETVADVDTLARTIAMRTDQGMGWILAGRNYMAMSAAFLDAAQARLGSDGPEVQRNLTWACGMLLITTSTVLQSRLGSSLGEVLDANLRKVDGRIKTGRVFKQDTHPEAAPRI